MITMHTQPKNILDQPEQAAKIDRLQMAELLNRFSEQIQEGVRIGKAFTPARSLAGDFDKVVFVGMGGSAIGGDVLRSLGTKELALPLFVVRHYDLPGFVDAKTLCIFSSYSGNTEETISAFRQGVKKGVKALSISSGGELAHLSRKASVPWIEIPKGLPPRAALGYSVFPLLQAFSQLKLLRWDARAVEETVELLDSLARKYGLGNPTPKNSAKKLAQALWNRWVVIYAGAELLDSAALRFRNQIEENAKAIASHHLVAEMNHNEILGWEYPKALVRKSVCVFLQDAGDHPRIQLRMDFTKKLLAQERKIQVEEIHTQGKSRLARLFSAIHLGDWTSYYLALLYRIDPTPVKVIEDLKKELAQVPQ